jgi:flagellar assembly protein FliH
LQVAEPRVKSSPNLIKTLEKEGFVKPWQPEVISGEATSPDDFRKEKDINPRPMTNSNGMKTANEKIFGFDQLLNTKNLAPSQQKIGNVHQWAPPSLVVEGSQSINSAGNAQNRDIEKASQSPEKDWSKKLEEIRVQAEDIISSTRKKVMEMIREAEGKVDQIHSLARMEGKEEGQKEAVELINQVALIVNETQSWRKQVLEESESAIIEIIQSIAKKLFGNGFVLEPTTVEQMVARAISEASRLGNLRVYLNPGDQESLISLWQDSELTVNGQKIQLVPSQNILRGGCFVEGEFGSVDSRVDIQLNLINDELSTMIRNEIKEGSE